MRARALKDFHKLRSTVFGIERSLGRKNILITEIWDLKIKKKMRIKQGFS